MKKRFNLLATVVTIVFFLSLTSCRDDRNRTTDDRSTTINQRDNTTDYSNERTKNDSRSKTYDRGNTNRTDTDNQRVNDTLYDNNSRNSTTDTRENY